MPFHGIINAPFLWVVKYINVPDASRELSREVQHVTYLECPHLHYVLSKNWLRVWESYNFI
jgi:hypothetical protein